MDIPWWSLCIEFYYILNVKTNRLKFHLCDMWLNQVNEVIRRKIFFLCEEEKKKEEEEDDDEDEKTIVVYWKWNIKNSFKSNINDQK